MNLVVSSELFQTKPCQRTRHAEVVRRQKRLTISFSVNAGSGKEPPIIIGKSATPRCFKGLKYKNNPHGLPYYSNRYEVLYSNYVMNREHRENKQLKKPLQA